MAPKAKAKAEAKAAAPKDLGTLQVKVKAGHNLWDRDTGILGDHSDPYTAVRLAGAEQKTPVLKDNLNPVWDKDNVFTFTVKSIDDTLELEVMNKCNLKSDQPLGKTTVALKTLKRGSWVLLSQGLEDCNGKESKLDFEVKLDVEALPFSFSTGPIVPLVSDPAKEKERLTKMIVAASEKAPAKVAPYLKQAAPFLASAAIYALIVLPYLGRGVTLFSELVSQMPEKVVYATLGFLMCFFGGVFPATIAAVEAWRLCGGKEALESVQDLYKEFIAVKTASEADDNLDLDHNGVKDVDEMGGKELLLRKTMLAARSVDPEKCNTAMSCILTGWMGVLATLKIRFARTVTLGQVIGKYLHKATNHVEPALKAMVPEDYKKWVPTVLEWTCKVAAISVAWWIERVISAVHSAIRGGLMFARYLLEYLHERNLLKFEDHHSSYIDEAIGWSIAFLGFAFQFMMGFSAPFPINLLLLPVSCVEYFVMWSVSAY
eukprot:TRINITY_DN4948_c0_g2_i1.p1 TRINITY_DN4948_c0_g2~~TRINITY_DN4948_c0_g2_i1.p1  ORF type:complete len:488 (+),score=146.45 TRINITY_DN4948_c0_g2_i1:71-1534(+)